MHRQILNLIAVLIVGFPSFVWAEDRKSSKTCDESWNEMKPIIDDLKRASDCAPFSFRECRENLGLAGAALAIGPAIGAKAGAQVRGVKLCDLKKAGYSIWKSEALAADCVDAIQDAAKGLEGLLEDSLKLRRTEVSHELIAALKKDKNLVNAADAYIQLRAKKRDMTSGERDKAWRALLKDHGLQDLDLGSFGTCLSGPASNARMCPPAFQKLIVLILDKEIYEVKGYRSVAVGRVDPDEWPIEVRHKARDLQAMESYVYALDSGKVTDKAKLQQIFADAEKHIHPALGLRAATYLEQTSSKLPGIGRSVTPDVMKNRLKNWGIDKAQDLAKKAPWWIAALLPVASFAQDCSKSADGCKDAAISAFESAIDVKVAGCAEPYSRYSTPQPDCKDTSDKWTAGLLAFVSADESLQREEVCNSSRFRSALRDFRDRSYPKAKVTCGANRVSWRDDVRRESRTLIYDGNGEVVKAELRTPSGNVYGYDLNFKDGAAIGVKEYRGSLRYSQYFNVIGKAQEVAPEAKAAIDAFNLQSTFAAQQIDECRKGNGTQGSEPTGGSSIAQ